MPEEGIRSPGAETAEGRELMWGLGTKLGFLGRPESVLSCSANLAAFLFFLFLFYFCF